MVWCWTGRGEGHQGDFVTVNISFSLRQRKTEISKFCLSSILFLSQISFVLSCPVLRSNPCWRILTQSYLFQQRSPPRRQNPKRQNPNKIKNQFGKCQIKVKQSKIAAKFEGKSQESSNFVLQVPWNSSKPKSNEWVCLLPSCWLDAEK